jgi:KaiC/GvpD/RAD55 family RecA-like ATPase
MAENLHISPDRIESGVPGFDPLVEGGLPEGRVHVASGPPGSGKTTFCTQFLTEGACNGEYALLLSVHETETQLLEDMGRYAFRLPEVMKADRLRFVNVFSDRGRRLITRAERTNAPGIDIDQLAAELNKIVGSNDITRLVVDSTMLIDRLFPDSESATAEFVTALKQVDATTLLISEMTDPSAYAPEHYLAHGVLFFHNYMEDGEMTRGIQLLKMPGTDIDCTVRPISFDERGVVVDPDDRVAY